MRRILAAVFLFTLVLAPGNSELEKTGPLLFEKAAAKGYFESNDEKQMNRAFREAGDAAIPFLAEKLELGEKDAYMAARALVYVGGRKAVDVLMDRYSRNKEEWVKAALCQAMASTGTDQEVRFLVDTITQALEGRESYHVVNSAVISLGLLKSQAGLSVIERISKDIPSHLELTDEGVAIDRIKKPPLVITGLDISRDQDGVIAALVESRMGSMKRSPVFYDSENNRMWRINGGEWSVSNENDPMSDTPRIWFDVFVTSDGSRALVGVNYFFADLDGAGDDYLLEKREGKWVVTGEIMKWVA